MSDQKLPIEQLFRTKYGEVLAALLRRYGTQRFELVEESVQMAFQRAVEKWSPDNLPDNPGGWLYTVARNAFLESVRRYQLESDKLQQMQAEESGLDQEAAV